VNGKLRGMTTTDYLISAALVLLVIPQVRGTRQTLHNALLPVAAVAAAAAYYLKSFPTQGHDVRLYVIGVVAGGALGVACGATTRLSRAADGVAFAKAGALAAALWIVGMASRTGFEYWATHSGTHHRAVQPRQPDHQLGSLDHRTAADGPRPGPVPAHRGPRQGPPDLRDRPRAGPGLTRWN